MNKYQHHRDHISHGRPGLTLLEVILSIAILGASMAVIGQLFGLGIRSARQARLRSEANILCDCKMAELAAGVLPPNSTGDQTIVESPDWRYSISVESSLQPGLLLATVTVRQDNSSLTNPVEMSVVRFLPDPDYEPDAEQ